MQICGHDALAIKFLNSLCHDTVYITLTSFLINYCVISEFCLRGMHDTIYDTSIVASLNIIQIM
jgi:hypothetical protein